MIARASKFLYSVRSTTMAITATVGLVLACVYAVQHMHVSVKDERQEIATASDNPQPVQEFGVANSAWRLWHDFGRVEPSKLYHHQFAIYNDSDDEWRIKNIVNTCSCTATDLSKKIIAPRQSATIGVAFRSSSKASSERKCIAVEFEDGRTCVLELRALTKTPISLSQSVLHFDYKVAEADIVVDNNSKAKFSDLIATSSADWINIQLAELEPDSSQASVIQQWKLHVKIDNSKLLPGKNDATIQVVSEANTSIAESLSITAYKTTPVQAIPSQLFLPNVTRDATVESRILLRVAKSLLPNISDSSLTVSDDLQGLLKIQTKPVSDSNDWLIIVSAKAIGELPSEDKIVQGSITVTVNSVSGCDIKIPVLLKINNSKG